MPRVSMNLAETGVGADEADRRRAERAELIVRVDYATVDEIFSEFTRDINEGGLFIETEKPQPTGTEVTMQFSLPGSEETLSTRATPSAVSRIACNRMGRLRPAFASNCATS